MQLGPNLTIRGDVVEKRGPSHALQIEAEKMRRAATIANASRLFRVPELIAFDSDKGVLRMEYLPGLRGIRRANLPADEYLSIVDRAGDALRAIHAGLMLPPELELPLPNELDHAGGGVFLHGDYSGENVCVMGNGGETQLVVIDWQISPRIGTDATFGTQYFDIGWFIGNLFRKPVYEYLVGPDVRLAAMSFLRGYLRNGQMQGELLGLNRYLERLCDYRRENHEKNLFLLKRILLAPGINAWKRFARTLDVRMLENA